MSKWFGFGPQSAGISQPAWLVHLLSYDSAAALGLPISIQDTGPWSFEEVETVLSIPATIAKCDRSTLHASLQGHVGDSFLDRLHHGWLLRLQDATLTFDGIHKDRAGSITTEGSRAHLAARCCHHGAADAWTGGLWCLLRQVLSSACTHAASSAASKSQLRTLLLQLVAQRCMEALMALWSTCPTTVPQTAGGDIPALLVLSECRTLAQRCCKSFVVPLLAREEMLMKKATSDAASWSAWLKLPASQAPCDDEDDVLPTPSKSGAAASCHHQLLREPYLISLTKGGLLLSVAIFGGITFVHHHQLCLPTDRENEDDLAASAKVDQAITRCLVDMVSGLMVSPLRPSNGSPDSASGWQGRGLCANGVIQSLLRPLLPDGGSRFSSPMSLVLHRKFVSSIAMSLTTALHRMSQMGSKDATADTAASCAWTLLAFAGPTMPPPIITRVLQCYVDTVVTPADGGDAIFMQEHTRQEDVDAAMLSWWLAAASSSDRRVVSRKETSPYCIEPHRSPSEAVGFSRGEVQPLGIFSANDIRCLGFQSELTPHLAALHFMYLSLQHQWMEFPFVARGPLPVLYTECFQGIHRRCLAGRYSRQHLSVSSYSFALLSFVLDARDAVSRRKGQQLLDGPDVHVGMALDAIMLHLESSVASSCTAVDEAHFERCLHTLLLAHDAVVVVHRCLVHFGLNVGFLLRCWRLFHVIAECVPRLLLCGFPSTTTAANEKNPLGPKHRLVEAIRGTLQVVLPICEGNARILFDKCQLSLTATVAMDTNLMRSLMESRDGVLSPMASPLLRSHCYWLAAGRLQAARCFTSLPSALQTAAASLNDLVRLMMDTADMASLRDSARRSFLGKLLFSSSLSEEELDDLLAGSSVELVAHIAACAATWATSSICVASADEPPSSVGILPKRRRAAMEVFEVIVTVSTWFSKKHQQTAARSQTVLTPAVAECVVKHLLEPLTAWMVSSDDVVLSIEDIPLEYVAALRKCAKLAIQALTASSAWLPVKGTFSNSSGSRVAPTVVAINVATFAQRLSVKHHSTLSTGQCFSMHRPDLFLLLHCSSLERRSLFAVLRALYDRRRSSRSNNLLSESDGTTSTRQKDIIPSATALVPLLALIASWLHPQVVDGLTEACNGVPSRPWFQAAASDNDDDSRRRWLIKFSSQME